MARIDVVMPQMGESIAEGTLSKWLKKVGDSVKRDEPMFEISTDKVDAEIPAPASGVIAEILVKEGQTVPVDTLVARLETDVNAAIAAPAAPAAAPAAANTPAVAAKSAAGAGTAAAKPASSSQPPRRLRTRSPRQRRLIGGKTSHEVVATRAAHGGGARHRDRRSARKRDCRPGHQEGLARVHRVGRRRRRRAASRWRSASSRGIAAAP